MPFDPAMYDRLAELAHHNATVDAWLTAWRKQQFPLSWGGMWLGMLTDLALMNNGLVNDLALGELKKTTVYTMVYVDPTRLNLAPSAN